MVTSCYAYACAKRFKKGGNVEFYSFPKDPALKLLWIKALKRHNWTPSSSSRICGKRFQNGIMDIANCLSLTSSVSMNPLKIDSNATALKTFEDVIKTSIGPYGKLKVVQNVAGGHVTVTSSSQRLLNIVSIQNIFLKMIIASAKTHLSNFGNNGLGCLLLTLKLINNSLASHHPFPLLGKLYEYFGKIFIDCMNLDKNACLMTVDLSNLANYQSVVESVISSKPSCILRSEDKKHLSILLLKAYLNCIPSSTSTCYSKNFNVITLEGINCRESCLFEGLLLKLSEMPFKKLPALLNRSTIKIALFTTSLSGDAEFPVNNLEVYDVSLWEVVLKSLKKYIENVIKSGIHILACQKVVHPSLRKQLEDADVLVLDRLGHVTSKYLEYLSGASNSSLYSELSIGCLSSISKKTVGKKDFLLLSNSSKPFWTMLICNFNEQAVIETKVVCQQAFDSLFHLLKKPVLCCGAGCTEIHTSILVENKVYENIENIKEEIGCTTSQVIDALQVFLQSIADLSVSFHQGCSLNFVTETTFGHLWRMKEGNFPLKTDRCACGQFSAELVTDSDWKFLNKSRCLTSDVADFRPKEILEKIDRSVILDEASSKINAYSSAFETASLLLRVSVSMTS